VAVSAPPATVPLVEPRQEVRAVVCPSDGQTDVPLHFTGGPEVPQAGGTKTRAGFPITITFPPTAAVRAASASVSEASGRAAGAWLSTPEKPARPRGQRNTVCLIPRKPLRPNTTYEVTARAEVDGRPWQKTWKFTTVNEAAHSAETAARLVEAVNVYRRRAGLAPVRLDPELSRGCVAHAEYLARNVDQPATQGLGGHEEDAALPGYSEEGRRAGKSAVIAIGGVDPVRAVDGWMATLYHRTPLLNPRLERVGLGCARSGGLDWVTVLDVIHGKGAAAGKDVVVYPVDGQAGVPLAFAGPEEPNPIPEGRDGRAGYPVTATFADRERLTGVTGRLTDESGREVPAWLSSPERPANPRFAQFQGPTACVIARAPLRPGTTYRVELAGGTGEAAWARKWSFTTGSGGSDHMADEVLARINSYRALAGVAPVRLDPGLSEGCAAHARYLVRNARDPAAQGPGLNDEKPALPGYSLAGRAAARSADVLGGAPSPLVQVDDLMGTFLRRVYVLDPQLRRVGFGCASDAGRGWVCVLDLIRGRGPDLLP
jgi:uncharacterized protein YkwD